MSEGVKRMKILLAIDGSKFSEAAIQMVATQNSPATTEVRILHIIEPVADMFPLMSSVGYYSPSWDQLQEELSTRAHELVARTAEQLRSAGFQVDTVVREGITRPDIVDIAAEWQADLIVLGAHGRRGLERLLLGSVSDFVARHAKCSVEIVRMPSQQHSRSLGK
jgi:nucleotide-binding universal stress UspA family protein